MKRIFSILAILIFFAVVSPTIVSADFSFSAAGDYDYTSSTTEVLNGIKNASTSFDMALGDFSYDKLNPESSWCNYVKNIVGTDYPFELVGGNHEEDGHISHIDNFSQCLPDHIGNIVGTYGKEYYFDYQNLARFIFISPNLTLDSTYYDYSAGTARNTWLTQSIDSARASGIKWIIVGMHEYCLNLEDADCPIGDSLVNTLVQKKVDLVLQGHAHQYERSKQLSLDDPNCVSIKHNIYNNYCVSGTGFDGIYKKGGGTVFMIVGTGGSNLSFIDGNDAEKPYFVSWSGGNSNPTNGFSKINITSSTLSSQFIPTTSGASFADSFSIVPPEVYSNKLDLITANSSWKYLDNGSNQGTAWSNQGFDDSNWKSGIGQFGFGDGDEATITKNNIVTTYFRKSFSVNDPSQLLSLTLNLVRDDGAVVYINGTEVKRTNMPSGIITYNTLANVYASPPEENYYNTYSIPVSVLISGSNTIAVEIHQATLDSVDMSFDLSLSATSNIVTTPTPSPTETLPITAPIENSPTPTTVPSQTPTPVPSPTPTPVFQQSNLISKNSSWKYKDDGSNQGTAWSNQGFDDSNWKSGNGQLGYGDGDETTIVKSNITDYFRKSFDISDRSQISSLTLNLIRDDGAVVYINGTEVVRTNMPSGTVYYNTLANAYSNSPQENYYNIFNIPSDSLINGNNIIAVEIHQASGSVDVSFDLSLTANVNPTITPTPGLTVTPTITPSPTSALTPTPTVTPIITPSLTPTPTPVPPTSIIRINSGGNGFTDSNGNVWKSDSGYNTGNAASVSKTISGTADQTLYRSERYDSSSLPELTYGFSLPNGNYKVILHFAEIYTGAQAVGKRIFNVSIENNLVLDHYDIFAEVGGYTATKKEFNVNLTDGNLNISFAHILENPKVSGIEIIPQ